MTAKELKASILDLAVRGKLVPQDPNDEPASVLFEKMRAEKQKLVKAGKIKKEKNPSEIYIASDGRPYEKFADGSETCIEDEIPFDLPQGWAWVRLGCVALSITDGDHQPPPQTTSGVPFLVISNVSSGEVSFEHTRYVVPEYFAALSDDRKPTTGDLLFTVTGSYGIPIRIETNREFCFQRHIALLNFALTNTDYLKNVLASPFVTKQCDDIATGTAQKTIPLSGLRKLLIPVPPVNEQRRILGKIEELMTKVGEYEKAAQQLTEFEARFPADLKKSILKAAVEGKLVPQDPKDEPASILVERIAEERKALVKSGKLKRDKHESVIFRGSDRLTYETRDGETVCIEDELPFKIPESWAWVRLGSICSFIHRGKSPQYSPIKKYPVVAQKCNQWSGFCIEKAQFIDPKTITKYTQEQFLQDDDLLWNSTGLGTLGRMAMYSTSLNPYKIAVADSHVTVIRVLKDFVDPRYVFAYLTGPSVQSTIEDKADGSTKQKELATSTVISYLVPLPPLAEQKRIVAQIEKMLKASATLTT